MFPTEPTPNRLRKSVRVAESLVGAVLVATMAIGGILLLAECIAMIGSLNRLTPWELADVMAGM